MKIWQQRLAVLMGGTAVILIVLIALGIFDPKPVGSLQWQTEPGTFTIPAGEQQVVWLETAVPTANYSVRLTIQHISGETDSLTGLLIGSESQNFTAAASPLGYIALWQNCAPPFCRHPSAFILPLAPWPHVRPDANEIWLDVRDGRTTIRINREILWQGAARPAGEIGVFLASYGETAVVEVTAVSLFAE